MLCQAGHGSEGIGQGSGAVPCRLPAQEMRLRGIRQQFPWSSARQAAGCCPGNIPHRDPITGRNCFVKYQTLMARPRLGTDLSSSRVALPRSPLPSHRTEQPRLGWKSPAWSWSRWDEAPHGCGGLPTSLNPGVDAQPQGEQRFLQPQNPPTKPDMHHCLFWFLIVIQIITQP